MTGIGTVYWVTGYSGAGKTTVATHLVGLLRELGRAVVQLDGDSLRAVFGDLHGYDRNDRFALASAYGRLCDMLARQGFDVVCATISMFHAVREWNRTHIANYYEVYLRVPAADRAARDAKGLYAAAHRGEIRNLVGYDGPAEEPDTPDLIIDNVPPVTPESAAERILRLNPSNT